MHTHLLAIVALGLNCSACANSYAIDVDRIHLPGLLGRYFGIGYSAGYHAHQPSHAGLNPRAPGFAAGLNSPVALIQPPSHAPLSYAPGPYALPSPAVAPYAPPMCQQCPSSSPPEPAVGLPQPPAAAPPVEVSPAPIIYQPPRASSPSDRAGALKQSQSLRHTSSASETPTSSAPPKTAAVARPSILELNAK